MIMTQEEKDLLFKDLCARLPYDVVVHAGDVDIKLDRNHRGLGVLYYEHYSEKAKKNCGYNKEDFSIIISGCFYGHDIKPYLFPLSSMTEEQWKELRNLIYEDFTLDEEFNEGLCYKTYGDILVWLDEKPINECYFIFDYFNKNHFDYRGLIPMGLAIDATGLNIY